MPMIDHRSGSGPPGRAGLMLVTLCCLIAHQFERIAAFDKGLTGDNEPFEFDRFDFGSILLLLKSPLGLLVIVELPLDAGGGAMESVDRRPEQLVEVGIE